MADWVSPGGVWVDGKDDGLKYIVMVFLLCNTGFVHNSQLHCNRSNKSAFTTSNVKHQSLCGTEL